MSYVETEKKKLRVGDVIVSSNLKCCVLSDIDHKNNVAYGRLTLNRGIVSSPMQYYRKVNATTDEGERVETKVLTTVDMASVDLSRAKAEFVVVGAGAGGGSTGYDPYPDGWELILKRLGEGRKYDPDGEEIFCYQYNAGCFTDSIYLKKFEVVGKLTMKVTFE